jgi:hypothetical protein
VVQLLGEIAPDFAISGFGFLSRQPPGPLDRVLVLCQPDTTDGWLKDYTAKGSAPMRYDEILGLLPRLYFGVDDGTGLELFVLELLFWVLIGVSTLALVRFRPAFLEKAEARLRDFSQYKRFWLVAFGVIVMLVRIALLPLIPVPIPIAHDENSYLLASDTFSHARLTNPSTPMWQHFETFHINVQPSYQSMYPPAQGLALAFGQILTGLPWAGVLLSTALMCGAIYWMLLGWLPAPWAWLGAALACLRYGISSYWVNSYFGGSVAALGGALVLGALPRFQKKPGVRIGLVLAVGLLILANSRPLEGLLFSIPILISVAVVLIKNGKVAWKETLTAVAPAVVLLAAGAGWMLYYNWRGTGNPLLLPYVINFNEYHISKPYFFQTPNPIPNYRHQSMRAVYVFWEVPNLLIAKYDLRSLVESRLNVYYSYFLWPFLLFIAPCAVAIWRSRLRVLLFSFALLATNLLAQLWNPQPQYAAPAAGAVFLALMFSLRHFRNAQSEYALWGSRAIVIVFALWLMTPIAEKIRDPFMINQTHFKLQTAESRMIESKAIRLKALPFPKAVERSRIESVLEAREGKHLVIVHYPFGDTPNAEWVYNGADLDNARVIWARDMGYAKNRELLDFYPDRKVWYVDHGSFPSWIQPYDQAVAPPSLTADLPAEAALPPISGALRGLESTSTAATLPTRKQYWAAVSR